MPLRATCSRSAPARLLGSTGAPGISGLMSLAAAGAASGPAAAPAPGPTAAPAAAATPGLPGATQIERWLRQTVKLPDGQRLRLEVEVGSLTRGTLVEMARGTGKPGGARPAHEADDDLGERHAGALPEHEEAPQHGPHGE